MEKQSSQSIHSSLLEVSQMLIASQRRSILLCEDTAAHAALIKRAIDTTIWDFTHVTRGEYAVEVFRKDSSAIVLLDLSLPDYNGLELLEHFKEINPLTPILIVTSLEDVKKSVEAMHLGACDYVLKDSHGNFTSVLQNAIERAWKTRIDKIESKLAAECRVAELIKAERIQAMQELVSGIYTEVNNPLSGLITFTDILRKQAKDSDEIKIIEQLALSAQKVASAVGKLKNITVNSTLKSKEDN